MFKFLTIFLGFLTMLSAPALAQITIGNNFQPAPGTTIQNRNDLAADSALFASMSSGTGGPMVWDFNSRNYGGNNVFTVIGQGSTPDIDSFPDANLVLQTIIGNDTVWSIFRSDASVFSREGVVSHAPSGNYIFVYRNNAPDWVFPIALNNQWTGFHHWTQYALPFHTDILDTIYASANAWGTAQYRTNSVPCLRIFTHERLTDNIYDSTGHLIYTFYSDIYTANFVSAGFNILASVSQSGQSPNRVYTSYASADFVGGLSDVSEDGTLPNEFNLSQNYPNPFNPTTTIKYNLPKSTNVAIDIFDILGNKIETLVNSEQQAGYHEVNWDGRNKASGIYLYKIQAGNVVETKRMTLLK